MSNNYNLAIKLLNNKKSVYNLDYKQVNDMIKYFENEIIIRKKELKIIKNNVTSLRSKLN